MSHSSNTNKVLVTGMTLAVTNMKKMVNFYQNVFGLDFEEVDMYGSKLYRSQLDSLELLFCPAALAQNTANQNRHQLNFEIESLEFTLAKISTHEGEIMGEKQEDGLFIQVGIKDPDNNSIVLKQKQG